MVSKKPNYLRILLFAGVVGFAHLDHGSFNLSLLLLYLVVNTEFNDWSIKSMLVLMGDIVDRVTNGGE